MPINKSSKPAASPAPATPAAKKSAAPAPSVAAPRKATVEPVKPSPASSVPKPTVGQKAPAATKVDPVNPPAPASKPAPAQPKAASVAKPETPNLTAITAKIDVGFGNALFIRGEGPGLSWNKGLPMKNSGSDAWTISFPKATRPILFKFLINDDTWSTGPDYSAEPGASSTHTPAF